MLQAGSRTASTSSFGESEAGDSLEPKRLRTPWSKLNLSQTAKANVTHISVCSKDYLAWWLVLPK